MRRSLPLQTTLMNPHSNQPVIGRCKQPSSPQSSSPLMRARPLSLHAHTSACTSVLRARTQWRAHCRGDYEAADGRTSS